jgi:hypothetical protein
MLNIVLQLLISLIELPADVRVDTITRTPTAIA